MWDCCKILMLGVLLVGCEKLVAHDVDVDATQNDTQVDSTPGDVDGDGDGDAIGDMEPVVRPRALIDHALWTDIAAEEDPFEDRPADPVCPEGAWRHEQNVVEIDTELCEYATLVQPTLSHIDAGDEVTIMITHYPLFALELAEAHVALVIDGTLLWERRVPIPAPTNVLIGRWVADRDIDAGADVVFHLHNHGANNWSLLTIETKAL